MDVILSRRMQCRRSWPDRRKQCPIDKIENIKEAFPTYQNKTINSLGWITTSISFVGFLKPTLTNHKEWFLPNKSIGSLINLYAERPMSRVQEDFGIVLTIDLKPRLRWTVKLHEHFVDVVTLLGIPIKSIPNTTMKVTGFKGLTPYHLKRSSLIEGLRSI
ncbi:hypothetical protein ACH5RR_025701 [Cinchona calisaya]|uniref:Homing endonuclease LAGLIDADG domain-containing protein n=1 Tax=Cinchona calisaya TaxID=153742 RepID=A0ABD2Z0D5_9GENT